MDLLRLSLCTTDFLTRWKDNSLGISKHFKDTFSVSVSKYVDGENTSG